MAHDQAHHSHAAPVGTETSRLSSDEGENEEREETTEKLDCHYSGYHPRPAAVSKRNLLIFKYWGVFFFLSTEFLKLNCLFRKSLTF